MSLITKMRRQNAIWWERGSVPDRFGQYSFEAPVEIDCRWEDTAEEFIDATGHTSVSRSKVYVDRDMKPGDRLKLGEMESDTPEDPMSIQDAHEIRRFDKMPNIKASEFLRTAYL